MGPPATFRPSGVSGCSQMIVIRPIALPSLFQTYVHASGKIQQKAAAFVHDCCAPASAEPVLWPGRKNALPWTPTLLAWASQYQIRTDPQELRQENQSINKSHQPQGAVGGDEGARVYGAAKRGVADQRLAADRRKRAA